MPRTRASWEPAHTPFFYAALDANQVVFADSQIVHHVIATNNGAAVATLKIFAGAKQIGSLSVPAYTTANWLRSPGLLITDLNITPSAALDVTVTIA